MQDRQPRSLLAVPGAFSKVPGEQVRQARQSSALSVAENMVALHASQLRSDEYVAG